MIMISILKKLNSFALCALVLGPLLVLPQSVLAQGSDALTLSIAPSLFDMAAEPGQQWNSQLRVINVNNYELTVYLDVVNFLPNGEGGDGRFVPIEAAETKGQSLAEWFVLPDGPVIVPAGDSVYVPITVTVPFDASPGGHFAAILVGTRPPEGTPEVTRVQTSQVVTSLFFARVAGDIREVGSIREFTTADSILARPEATFELRFENKGNVHLQPQGEIKILNMWGQERGIVPINQNSKFGNVLPESIRKFTFTWEGEWSIADIGRYTAVATLAYGTEARQFTSSKTAFWVIPFKLLLSILAGLALFIYTVTWLVRRYVRSMLTMAGIDVNEYKQVTKRGVIKQVRRPVPLATLRAPLYARVSELLDRLKASASVLARGRVIIHFLYQNRLFVFGVGLIITFVVGLLLYVANARTESRNYEIVYVNADAEIRLSSEEIIYDQLRRERVGAPPKIDDSLPQIRVVNRSGVPGQGAEVRLRLEALGYAVVGLSADVGEEQTRTAIIVPRENEAQALRLSTQLNNALVSTGTDTSTSTEMVVYVGSDIFRKE